MNTINNAIERRNYLQFDILVNQRVGLNKPDAKGLTPLMKVNHEPKARNATEMLRLLLRQSPKIDMTDRKGRNALMHAALVGNNKSVELLLEAGYFDPAMRDHAGNAPIHYAAMSGDLTTVEILHEHLKKYRVKADLRNDQGMTPLHMASSQGHLLAARYLQSECGCSLTVRDGMSEKTAREWLEQTCDIPQYMDPFGRNADLSAITPKKLRAAEFGVDDSKVRVFLFMKDKPTDIHDDEDEERFNSTTIKPPWDINTNPLKPPKYLNNGQLNPARLRPNSARSHTPCDHHHSLQTARPFSAPCGYPEFSSWKHPADIKPYLNIGDISNCRRYTSVSDLTTAEGKLSSRANNSKLLSARSSKGR